MLIIVQISAFGETESESALLAQLSLLESKLSYHDNPPVSLSC